MSEQSPTSPVSPLGEEATPGQFGHGKVLDLGGMAVRPAVEDLITLPYPLSVEEDVTQPVRYIIDHVPSQEEFDLNYGGKDGQYDDANKLIAAMPSIDPEGNFTTVESRKAKIASMSRDDFTGLLKHVHGALYPDSDEVFASYEVTLGRNTDDGRKVGTIGIGPEDRDEVFDSLLHGIKVLAEKDDLYGAGYLAAQTIVLMQPFEDGNKRTARAVYELIGYGFDGEHFDVHALRRSLAYTKEARNSMSYQSITGTPREPYALGKVGAERQRSLMDFSRGIDQHDIGMPSLFNNALAHLGDDELISQTSKVLQQNTFGAEYMFDGINPDILAEYQATKDPKLLESAIREYCSTLTPQTAQGLIERDKENRKEYVKKLVDSSTGEQPMQQYDYAGRYVEGQRVNLILR
ncbi:Fic family protein [Candidatus Saccharibacteria bacterium]|nr:Fic family protein [Candidatus Saccharibacteria bacterium]